MPENKIKTVVFDRERERQALSTRLKQRRSLLVYGLAGVGKTLLVQDIIKDKPQFLYCADSTTIHTVLHSIAAQLWHVRNNRVVSSFGRAGIAAIGAKSAANIKGVVLDALRLGEYWVVLDHIKCPSHAFAAVAKEIIGWCTTPVVSVARSEHMEDLGFLQPIYAERSDRFEVKNFDVTTAEQFAIELVKDCGLLAANLDIFLERLLEYSQGNPGAIRRMVEMAKQPGYRSHENIKVAPLYIDFRMNWTTRA